MKSYLRKINFLNNSKCNQILKHYSQRANLIKEFESYEKDINIKEPSLNFEYLFNKNNRNVIENNLKLRKNYIDLNEFYKLVDQYEHSKDESVRANLIKIGSNIPNTTHPESPRDESYKIIKTINEKKTFDFKPKSFLNLTNKIGLSRSENIAHYLGNRSYYFSADLCLLENAIIQHVLNRLKQNQFQFLTVSDILNENIIQRSGMLTRGKRSQVYHLEPEFYGEGWCLSGTAEMGINKYLMNRTLPLNELPLKLAAMSKCYRAEISETGDEKGVYRVHCFTKIEMFGVTRPEESESNLEEFRNFEENLFSSFGLHIRTLDMGIHELGAQAHRKYDVEAWMPGRKNWGELSSCSDCTDYQSRRLNIKSEDGNFVHTINGTACAIPRLLMALVETQQNRDGTINIPECLQGYMFNTKMIGDRNGAPLLFKVKMGLSKAKKKELAKAALAAQAD